MRIVLSEEWRDVPGGWATAASLADTVMGCTYTYDELAGLFEWRKHRGGWGHKKIKQCVALTACCVRDRRRAAEL